jgi:hypothetical protein
MLTTPTFKSLRGLQERYSLCHLKYLKGVCKQSLHSFLQEIYQAPHKKHCYCYYLPRRLDWALFVDAFVDSKDCMTVHKCRKNGQKKRKLIV